MSIAREVDKINNSMGIMKNLELKNDFNKYRKIVSDGNAFFRAFMISYFEHLILANKTLLLKQFIVEFNNIMDVHFKKNNIKINKALLVGVFSIIIYYLETNLIKKAHQLFLKSIYKI